MPESPLRISILPNTASGRRVVRLDGPLTLTNFFEFQILVRADHARDLIVDVSGVPYIDSAGIGCLMNGYVSHHNAGRCLWLVGATDRVRNSLRVSRVEQFFPTFATVEDVDAGRASSGLSA